MLNLSLYIHIPALNRFKPINYMRNIKLIFTEINNYLFSHSFDCHMQNRIQISPKQSNNKSR